MRFTNQEVLSQLYITGSPWVNPETIPKLFLTDVVKALNSILLFDPINRFNGFLFFK